MKRKEGALRAGIYVANTCNITRNITTYRVVVRQMGGAPRNPASKNHFVVWIVESSGCHCTDAFGGDNYRRVQIPPRSTSPFSD